MNFRVESGDGRLLGVIGVGLQISTLEDTIRSYERNYGLSVFIINAGGSPNSFTGDTDIFINEDDLANRTKIEIQLDKQEDPRMLSSRVSTSAQGRLVFSTAAAASPSK